MGVHISPGRSESVAEVAAAPPEEPIKTAPSGYYHVPTEDPEIEQFLQTYGTADAPEEEHASGDISFAAARGTQNQTGE